MAIPQADAQKRIAAYIDHALVLNQKWKKLHQDTVVKPYCFSAPLPIEKDKVYMVGKTYYFILRTFNKELCDYLVTQLAFLGIEQGFNDIRGVGIDLRKFNIDDNNLKIKSTSGTDVDYTVFQKHILNSEQPETVIKAIENNIRTKARQFFGLTLGNNLITSVESGAHMRINIKDTTFTCASYTMLFNDTTDGHIARDIALMVGTGLKNARGFGFCIPVEEKSINKNKSKGNNKAKNTKPAPRQN